MIKLNESGVDINNLTIKARLNFLIVLVSSLIVAAAVFSVQSYKNAFNIIRTLYEDRVVCLKQLKAVSDGYALSINGTVNDMASGVLNANTAMAQISAALAKADREWKAYSETFMDPEEKAIFSKTQLSINEANSAVSHLMTLMRDGNAEAISSFARSEMKKPMVAVIDDINELTSLQLKVADLLYLQSRSDYDSLFVYAVVFASVAVVSMAGAAWVLVRSIVAPLKMAVQVAETVAEGDLNIQLQVQGKDEAHQLLAALKRMSGSLSKIVQQVRSSSESIALGSAEIAMGNSDLSYRTEAQASNLQQTAASMEQLMGTVRQNAEAAKTAAQLAASATEAAVNGGNVAHRAVASMEHINASSRRISDIVNLIDGIAFQTNILALNAAVEAARAGTHGRGFAVVAGEVRSLAQRCASAAKEIKELINESLQRVDEGVHLVGSAGDMMKGITEKIGNVSQLISEISEAGGEQSRGLSQVGQAVSQLDQATQQNAALVEQSAAAAESLKLQAAQMAKLVARFRIDSSVL